VQRVGDAVREKVRHLLLCDPWIFASRALAACELFGAFHETASSSVIRWRESSSYSRGRRSRRWAHHWSALSEHQWPGPATRGLSASSPKFPEDSRSPSHSAPEALGVRSGRRREFRAVTPLTSWLPRRPLRGLRAKSACH